MRTSCLGICCSVIFSLFHILSLALAPAAKLTIQINRFDQNDSIRSNQTQNTFRLLDKYLPIYCLRFVVPKFNLFFSFFRRCCCFFSHFCCCFNWTHTAVSVFYSEYDNFVAFIRMKFRCLCLCILCTEALWGKFLFTSGQLGLRVSLRRCLHFR